MNAQTARRHHILAGDGSNLSARMSYAPDEREGVHAQKSRLAKRGRVGHDWDGEAANDNIAWPLATALIKEKNTELLKYAMAYRRTYQAAKSEATLGGTSVSVRDDMSLDRHTVIRADGRIAYKHVRQRTAAEVDIPAKRYVAPFADEDCDEQRNSVRIPKPWKGDEPVNNMIDAQRELARLQSALGHLCEPFELACIDGRTLQEVGNSVGTANRAGAMGAGRAIVHMALVTLRDFMRPPRRADLAA